MEIKYLVFIPQIDPSAATDSSSYSMGTYSDEIINKRVYGTQRTIMPGGDCDPNILGNTKAGVNGDHTPPEATCANPIGAYVVAAKIISNDILGLSSLVFLSHATVQTHFCLSLTC